ncbi:MAG: DUF3168 domain-containing protein [Caldilineaceae bacterium]
MTLSEALYTHISTESNVAALQSTRFYPQFLPQKPTYPASTYRIVSMVPWQSRDDKNFMRARVQIDCYATTHLAVTGLAEAMHDAMVAYTKASNPRVVEVQLANRTDTFDGETEAHRASADFFVWFEQ